MVLLKELRAVIAQNMNRSYMLPLCRMKQVPSVTVDSFKNITEPVQIVSKVQTMVHKVTHPVIQKMEDESGSQPVPTRALMVRSPPPPAPMVLSPPTPAPAPAPPAPAQAPTPVEPVNRRGSPVDPIAIGISLRDPMYAIATPAVKQSIQAEEARLLEAKLAELYKSESGRSRGWVKTHLEAFLVPRAANGSQNHGKAVFDWSQLWTDKQTSATLDYICAAKDIRLAVWNEATHEIGLWPAADSTKPRDGPTPLLHVTAQGVERPAAPMEGWKLRAPLSVEHALEKLTLAELESVATNIGLTPSELTGKKADRVRTIATARMALRLKPSHAS